MPIVFSQMRPTNPAYRGQEHYSPWFLRIYDVLVLDLYGPLVWRCPTRRLVDHYSQHVGSRHLDVGPGSGYFLDTARVPEGVKVVLMDPNRDVLAYAARRLRRFNPLVLQADVCKPLPTDGRFDSIALNYVLHCLPGPMSQRSGVIRTLASHLEPDGVLFGATLLGSPELHTWLSGMALRQNNRLGFFDNLSDTQDALRKILGESFARVDLELVGSVAVFSAAKPLVYRDTT
jgi:SAM-dependent methyltransferase